MLSSNFPSVSNSYIHTIPKVAFVLKIAHFGVQLPPQGLESRSVVLVLLISRQLDLTLHTRGRMKDLDVGQLESGSVVSHTRYGHERLTSKPRDKGYPVTKMMEGGYGRPCEGRVLQLYRQWVLPN